jgi:hypothetical protein
MEIENAPLELKIDLEEEKNSQDSKNEQGSLCIM